MKNLLILVSGLLAINYFCQAQQLTVAVSAFDAKGGLSRDEAESVTELFRAELAKNRTIKVVDRNNFDKILSEMKFQDSDWADSKRVAQLGKALNANGIIRGTVMSLGGQIVITATALDINTTQILSSSTLQMRRIDELFDKLPAFAAEIVKNLPGVSVVNTPASGAIAIEVSTKVAGKLYFQDEEIAELWGGDTHTIPIEKPGTYIIKLGLLNKIKLIRAVDVTARGITKVNFTNVVNIGDEGPGGGTIFFAERGKYMECSGEFGTYNWEEAVNRAKNYRGGGLTNWHLPNKEELYFMYQNLHLKGLGCFGSVYWSSSQYNNNNAWLQYFSDGDQVYNYKYLDDYNVRAVRTFSF